MNFKFKTTFCKFRLSVLPFRIVTGRWERPKLVNTERYCLQCNEYKKYDKFLLRFNIQNLHNSVCETEIHFALKRSQHANLRSNLFRSIDPSYFLTCKTDVDILYVLCNNPEIIRKFAVFIANCYENRK